MVSPPLLTGLIQQPSCCVFCPGKLREHNTPPNCSPRLCCPGLFSQLPARYLSDVTNTYIPQSEDTCKDLRMRSLTSSPALG